MVLTSLDASKCINIGVPIKKYRILKCGKTHAAQAQDNLKTSGKYDWPSPYIYS